jgi:hypothetical protein
MLEEAAAAAFPYPQLPDGSQRPSVLAGTLGRPCRPEPGLETTRRAGNGHHVFAERRALFLAVSTTTSSQSEKTAEDTPRALDAGGCRRRLLCSTLYYIFTGRALVVNDLLFIENNAAPLGDGLLKLGGTLNDRSKVIGAFT